MSQQGAYRSVNFACYALRLAEFALEAKAEPRVAHIVPSNWDFKQGLGPANATTTARGPA